MLRGERKMYSHWRVGDSISLGLRLLVANIIYYLVKQYYAAELVKLVLCYFRGHVLVLHYRY